MKLFVFLFVTIDWLTILHSSGCCQREIKVCPFDVKFVQVLEYGTPKEVLGLNNQMTQIFHQLLETHPAQCYHKVDHTDVIHFDANADASVRVIRDNLGRLSVQQTAFDESINKVRFVLSFLQAQ